MNFPTNCLPSCIVTRIRQFIYSNIFEVFDIDILSKISPTPLTYFFFLHTIASSLLHETLTSPTLPLQNPAKTFKTLINSFGNNSRHCSKTDKLPQSAISRTEVDVKNALKERNADHKLIEARLGTALAEKKLQNWLKTEPEKLK